MPTIPSPFIGGAEPSQPERAEKQQIEPPFYIEPDAPDPPDRVRPASEVSPEPDTVASVAETAEEGPAGSEYEGPVPVQQAADPAAEESGLPDFLLGPDSAADPAARTGEQDPGGGGPDVLARTAEELLGGAHGDEIRALLADLGTSAADIAIPRAFAAGFLAARRREED